MLVLVSVLGYHWLGRADIALLLLCLLGILCGSLFLDFLSRLSRRALRLQLELKTESRTDALTGLPNLRAFLEDAEGGWQRAIRRSKSIAVMFIDADHFKQINDQFGHDVGDAVLQALASAIANTLAGPQPCGRLGGEEFGVLLQDITLLDACAQAERVRAGVQQFGWALEQLPQMHDLDVDLVNKHLICFGKSTHRVTEPEFSNSRRALASLLSSQKIFLNRQYTLVLR